MSLAAQPSDEPRRGWPLPAARLALMLAAAALVGLSIAGLAWLTMPVQPPPPPRNPFGVGPHEAAPAAGGLGAYVLAWQGQFYREITAAIQALKSSGAALPGLLGVGFAYGVLHAAGPGHGKAVISAYIVADDTAAAKRALGLSLAAALAQAAVGIVLVLGLSLILSFTFREMNSATRAIELASFAAMAVLGLWLMWSKAGLVLRVRQGDAAACPPGCVHDAVVAEAQDSRQRSWRETAGVVLAAGIRPCAGGIILLTFALSQGLAWAGIAGVLAMALGVALTTGTIALLAVAAKGLALRLAGGRGQRAALAVRGLELLAAAFVAMLGLIFLAGLWTGGAS